jgi:hypothetical protein
MSAARDVLVEYLATSRIGEKGQLTVPKEYEGEIQRTLPEARERVFARRYPKLTRKEKPKREAGKR